MLVAPLEHHVTESHFHGPRCGHMAIVHLDGAGRTHIGFVSAGGEVECFVPEQNAPSTIPLGSLSDVCLFAYDTGRLGIKRRTAACSKNDRCWESMPDSIVPLVREDKTCNIISSEVYPVAFNHHADGEVAKRCPLTQRPTIFQGVSLPAMAASVEATEEFAKETSLVVKHLDHVDSLIRNEAKDSAEWHCHDPATELCHNASLVRPTVEFGGTYVLAGFAEWASLYLIANQSALSLVHISKGLCCKKENPKIREIMSSVSKELGISLRTEINIKKRTVAVWHGGMFADPIRWITAFTDALASAGFVCGVQSIGGTEVVRAEIEIQVTAAVEDAGALVEQVLSKIPSIRAYTRLANGKFCVYVSKGGRSSWQSILNAFAPTAIGIRFVSVGKTSVVESILETSTDALASTRTVQRALDATLDTSLGNTYDEASGRVTIHATEEQRTSAIAAVTAALGSIGVRIRAIDGVLCATALINDPQAEDHSACCEPVITHPSQATCCQSDTGKLPHNVHKQMRKAECCQTEIVKHVHRPEAACHEPSAVKQSSQECCQSVSATIPPKAEEACCQHKTAIKPSQSACCQPESTTKHSHKVDAACCPPPTKRHSHKGDAACCQTKSSSTTKHSFHGADTVCCQPKSAKHSHSTQAACCQPEANSKPASIASLAQPPPSASTSTDLVRSVLSIEGVCCQTEVPAVLAICREVPGLANVSVSVVTKQVIVFHPNPAEDSDYATICARALTDNGFPSQVVSTLGRAKAEGKGQATRKSRWECMWGLKWNLLLATLLWLLSWLSYVQEPTGMKNFKYLSVVAIALTLPAIAIKGLRSLRRGIMDINFLMSVAVIGALAIQDFHEGAAVTVIFCWSDWLESRASSRARNALLRLMELKPEIARTEAGEEVSVDSVKVGQILMVLSGEKIAVDGELLSAFCEVDESNLTGEARPVTKSTNDKLSAGTMLVSNSTIRMRCTALADDSAVARMVRLVEEASRSRSPVEQLINTIAKYYTPIMVFTALSMISFPWIVSNAAGEFWLRTGLTLLVVACPCALVISTPLTYVCAIAKAASFGVLIKGGKYLETLTQVRVLASDKTGTLTRGLFEVVSVFENEPWMTSHSNARATALALLSKIERQSVHPIARAIERYASAELSAFNSDVLAAVATSTTVETVETLPGKGVMTTMPLIGGVIHFVKSEAAGQFLKQEPPAQVRAWTDERMAFGDTVSWLIFDGELVLGLAACDQIRPEAASAITKMQELGISVVALTGDNLGAGQVLHQKLPQLAEVYAGLTPAGKVEHVSRLKVVEGKKTRQAVAMVGDGVNDAPALSACDVGIAMGVGSAPLALETADCALMDNDLLKIHRLFQLAQQTRRVLIENIVFALVVKFIVLGLTLAGYVTLGIAIAVDVGSMLVVTLHAMSILRTSMCSKNVAMRVDDHAANTTPYTGAEKALMDTV